MPRIAAAHTTNHESTALRSASHPSWRSYAHLCPHAPGTAALRQSHLHACCCACMRRSGVAAAQCSALVCTIKARMCGRTLLRLHTSCCPLHVGCIIIALTCCDKRLPVGFLSPLRVAGSAAVAWQTPLRCASCAMSPRPAVRSGVARLLLAACAAVHRLRWGRGRSTHAGCLCAHAARAPLLARNLATAPPACMHASRRGVPRLKPFPQWHPGRPARTRAPFGCS